ncbi:MAG: hypothetical protein ACI9X4_000580, partial [Glaciecola sp.]
TGFLALRPTQSWVGRCSPNELLSLSLSFLPCL